MQLGASQSRRARSPSRLGGLGLVLACVAGMMPGSESKAEPLAMPELPHMFVCQQDKAAFTVAEVPGLAAAAAGDSSDVGAGSCARLTGPDGAVAFVEIATTGDATARFAADLARHQAIKTSLEQRGGDPIAVGSRSLQIKKYFGSAPFETRAWLDAPGGVAVGFTLSAPTREAHDKSYQAFRSFVRTWRTLDPAAGVN
jgi:hypothetical protein